MSTKYNIEGLGVLEIRQEQISVSTMGSRERAPDWSFTDAAGHVHTYDGALTPTLETVREPGYWCPDCHDEHADYHLACRKCGETVNPGTRPAPAASHYMAGRVEYLINDVPVSKEQAKECIEKAKTLYDSIAEEAL